MKQFACGDVVPGCDAQWTRATDDELFAEISAHAASVHDMSEIPDELAAQVKRNIRIVG